MKRFIAIAAALLALPAVHAQMKDMDMKGMEMKAPAAAVHKGSGKVSRIDAAKGTVTIAHGPVQTLNWPAMTMTFKAKDKAMLRNVKPGANVEFSFTQSGKDYLLTEIR